MFTEPTFIVSLKRAQGLLMTTTNPPQKDHPQYAVDVLEAENAELRQMATVLVYHQAGCTPVDGRPVITSL